MARTVTIKWFSNGPAHLARADVDWEGDTIKVALLDAVPNQDTPDNWDDISATEVVGDNWPAGGIALTGKAITVTGATNVTALDAADLLVEDVDVPNEVEAIAIYKVGGSAATSPLLGYGDLDQTTGSAGGDLTIPWPSGGILSLTAAS